MKLFVIVLIAASLTACGTIGGAVSGMGQDLQKAGEWLRN